MPPAAQPSLGKRVSKAGASGAKPGQDSQRGQPSDRKKSVAKGGAKGKERKMHFTVPDGVNPGETLKLMTPRGGEVELRFRPKPPPEGRDRCCARPLPEPGRRANDLVDRKWPRGAAWLRPGCEQRLMDSKARARARAAASRARYASAPRASRPPPVSARLIARGAEA